VNTRCPRTASRRLLTCAALLLLAACGGSRAGSTPALVAGAPARPQPSAPFALTVLFPLIYDAPSGTVPDTTVTVTPGAPRVIVLRHTAQDLDVFAALSIAAGSFGGNAPVTVRLTPIAGEYGVEIQASGPILEPLTLEFRYGRHFTPPPGAMERYVSRLGFERALAIAQQTSATEAVLLPSSRPALDFLAAAIFDNGRYFVAAPQ